MNSDERDTGHHPDEAATYLIESGVLTRLELADAQARVARGELTELEERARLEGIAASLSADEVASRLGLGVDEVELRRVAGRLAAFTSDGEHRYPTWQFTADPQRPVLPGLPQLVSAIPDEMHPASVLGFMTTPQNSLRIDGRKVTPPEWLLAGGDPQDIINILHSFLMS